MVGGAGGFAGCAIPFHGTRGMHSHTASGLPPLVGAVRGPWLRVLSLLVGRPSALLSLLDFIAGIPYSLVTEEGEWVL